MEVRKFSSVSAMIDDLNDFASDNGTFKVLKEKPLHIQLLTQTVAGESKAIAAEEVRRAIVYGVIRSFMHTDIDQITVTAASAISDAASGKMKQVKGSEVSVLVRRQDTLELLRKMTGIKEFSDLEEMEKAGDLTFPGGSAAYQAIRYNDHGKPGLDAFFKALASK